MKWSSSSGVRFRLDLPQEAQELLVAVPGEALVDDLAGRHVQGSEEGRGAVPLVVVRHRTRSPLLQREARLGAVQRLDLALRVEGEDDRPLRRRQI